MNGPRALDLEISKARQYAALEAAGVPVPRTVLVLATRTAWPPPAASTSLAAR